MGLELRSGITSMKRRVNLFAGPSSGKSTVAAKLFSLFKEEGRTVELVREYVKDWAYENRHPEGFDQFYITAKQLHKEEIPLRNGVEFIITDSPLLLGAYYCEKYGEFHISQNLQGIAYLFDIKYPPLNIFINRADRPYNQNGRFQNEKDARQIDDEIQRFLTRNGEKFVEFTYNQIDEIRQYIMENISCNS